MGGVGDEVEDEDDVDDSFLEVGPIWNGDRVHGTTVIDDRSCRRDDALFASREIEALPPSQPIALGVVLLRKGRLNRRERLRPQCNGIIVFD